MPLAWTAMGCAAGAAGLVAYAAGCPISRIWGKAEMRGDPAYRAIALSFDDGPSDNSLDVLEVLDRFGARATFFVCGRNVDRSPHILRQIAAAGHEIANHTYSHPNLLFSPARRIRHELGWTQLAVEQACGQTPILFRPPYGVRGPHLSAALAHHGLRCVLWSTIGHDWRLPAPRIVRRITAGVTPGAIICLHDGEDIQPRPDRRATVRALTQTLPRIADLGYALRPVSEILDPGLLTTAR